MAGNRCGHDRRNPRLTLRQPSDVTRGKPFPYLILRALERVADMFRARWRAFPELGHGKRSERLEAMVLVALALFRNCDRLTCRVGRRKPDGTFAGISMRTIARWAGIADERAFRALWDLRDAGYVECYQAREQLPSGAWLCKMGVRRITRLFWERMGLYARLRRDRAALWKEQQSARLVQTIEQRRQLRRLHGQSSLRARNLAQRTTRQVAEGHSQTHAPKVYTLAEIEAGLNTWRSSQTDNKN